MNDDQDELEKARQKQKQKRGLPDLSQELFAAQSELLNADGFQDWAQENIPAEEFQSVANSFYGTMLGTCLGHLADVGMPREKAKEYVTRFIDHLALQIEAATGITWE